MKAGFSEIDITPPAGLKKVGWMQDLEARVILDPLFARVVVFDDGANRIAFIQLDLLSVRWTDTNDLRRRIESEYGFPGDHVMVSATHNHAGPGIGKLDPVERHDAYCETLKQKCVRAFGEAQGKREEVELGFNRSLNFEVAHNRRTMMRDGTVRSQTGSNNPDFLCLEGPRDPEVAVVAARNKSGKTLGLLYNYACHPTHHGGSDEVTAGWPGVASQALKDSRVPVCLFLNGAYGNVIHHDYELNVGFDMKTCGDSIAASVKQALEGMTYRGGLTVEGRIEKRQLPFRTITDDEYHGRVRGAQRYRSDALYEGAIDRYVARIKRGETTQPVDIQVLRLGDLYFAGMPAEYFVEFQIRIKTECHPKHAFVVGGANGMIGYMPTREAFARGGYETTLGPPSKMGPGAGEIMAETAIKMIREQMA